MTPKEKAKYLFDKYATFVVMWSGDTNTIHENCKQCALIAVDEILAAPVEDKTGEQQAIKYWTRVKKHIKEL